MAKKKELNWDEIGKAIGKKMEQHKEGMECSGWKHHWIFHREHHGGAAGRLIFIIGVLYALNYAGMLVKIPLWTLVVIAVGFMLMKF